MRISKGLSTVTPISKILSAVLFIMLPILGFIIGLQYSPYLNNPQQNTIPVNQNVHKQIVTSTPMPNNNQIMNETDNQRKKSSLFEYPTQTELNAQRIGYIKKVFTQNGRNYIDVDYVLWFSDGNESKEATKACIEDGGCLGCPGDLSVTCVPNGYFIRNKDARTIQLEINYDAIIETYYYTSERLAPVGQGPVLNKMTFADLNKIFEGNLSDEVMLQKALYNITIANGIVTHISQQYQP